MTERDVFIAALKLEEPAQRRAYLASACAGQPELRRQVEGLLRLHDGAGSFLEQPAGTPATTAAPRDATEPSSLGEDPGTVLGPYKLIEPIGEGGMGKVWMAQQTAPVKRLVAVKLIKAGMDSKQVIARFEAERQALALMDHPHIARVLDGGTTNAGRPYFVMDLVKGVPITRYCDERRLSPRQRLELFIPVCAAIQHAHQKGIIHRDIKPSNVLVALYDGKPVPKVIDFGVAKAAGQTLTEKTLVTGFGTLVGTLEYMSPEQAELNNLDIDTRSDVYSLGVLLYELLTGSTPVPRERIGTAGLLEALRIIREEETPRPSTRLSTARELPGIASCRGVEPARLPGLVRGELDWIVMKALDKDRGRRYESAAALTADVQRYLADEPVLACPPATGYRLRKFVRRHRGPVLAITLLVLALLAGVFGTAVGLVRAEQRAEGERQANESAQKRLTQIEKGINILSSIFDNLDPMAEEVEGRPLRAILGDRLEQAAAELEGEAVGDPLVVARLQDRLARTYLGLGQGRRAAALFAKAAATRRAQLGADDRLTLESLHNLAVAYEAAGRHDEAIGLFERVRETRTRVLGPDQLDTMTTLHELGVAYTRSGKANAAILLLERVRDVRMQQLGEDHDHTLATQQQLASAYLSAERRGDAVALAEKVWKARVNKHGDDHPKAIAAMSTLAYVYQGSYRMKKALELLEDARDKIVPKLGDYHPLTLQILRNLGHMLWVYVRTTEAIALLEQVRERELMVLGGQHPNTLPTLWDLAAAYSKAGQSTKALSLYQQAAAAVEKVNFEHSHAPTILASLALCLENSKQLEQAEAWRHKALELAKRRHGAESRAYAEELIRIASLKLQQHKPAGAEPNLRQAIGILERRPNAGEMLYAQALLGAALADQGRNDVAEPLLINAYQGMKNFTQEHRGQGMLPWSRQRDAAARLVQLYEATHQADAAAEWRGELAAVRKAAEKAAQPKGK